MLLTKVNISDLPPLLSAFAAGLEDNSCPSLIFQKIAATFDLVQGDGLELSRDENHRQSAIALLSQFKIKTYLPEPGKAITWNGKYVRSDMEPSVIIHELAHFQVAAPKRRYLPDFGLGAGPETEDTGIFRLVNFLDADLEEVISSLLGILWEVKIGQPAILAFLEQNWLEGGASQRNIKHFIKSARFLHRKGFVDDLGNPTEKLRIEGDVGYFDSWD